MQSSFLDSALIGKLLLGLSGVLLAMGGVLLGVRFLQKKRLFLTGIQQSLRVINTFFLSSKQKLTILQWDNTQYLIMTTGDQIALIDKKHLETPQEAGPLTATKTRVPNT